MNKSYVPLKSAVPDSMKFLAVIYLKPEVADYAHHINTVTPGFSYLPTTLSHVMQLLRRSNLLVKSRQFSSEIIRKNCFNI